MKTFNQLRNEYSDPSNDPVDRCAAIIAMGRDHPGLPNTLIFFEQLGRNVESWSLDINEAYALAQALPAVCEKSSKGFKIIASLANFPAAHSVRQGDRIFLFKLLREGMSKINKASVGFNQTEFTGALKALGAAIKRERIRASNQYSEHEKFLCVEAREVSRLRNGKLMKVSRAAVTAVAFTFSLIAGLFQVVAGLAHRR